MESKVKAVITRPGVGQVRVRRTAVALGANGATVTAGTIAAIGEDAIGFVAGDRVAYWGGATGDGEFRVVDVENLIGIPSGVSDEQAAALLPTGLAARMLVKEVHAVGGNDTVVVHDAGSVLGSMTVAWAKALGATVIATVGTATAASRAEQSGADQVIVFGQQNVAARVAELTAGRGADVVYDGVGDATVAASLASLRRGGTLVLFGTRQHQLDEQVVTAGRITVIRPQLGHQLRGGSIQQGAADLFLAIRSGVFDGVALTSYPAAQVATAMADLDARRVDGPIVLTSARESVGLAA